MAILGTVQEAFTSSATPTGWTEFTGGSATVSYSSTGVSVNFPALTGPTTDGDLTLATTFDLTGSFGRVNVLSVTGAGLTNTDCAFRIRQNSSNYLSIFYEAGTLFFSKVVATTQTNIASVTYNAANHAWWQIREKGGTVYWETSVDGVTWTTQTSQATPITITAVDVLIGGICFGADVSPPPFKFRYFNYPLSGTTTSTSSTSASTTSTSISSTSSSTSSISTSSTSKSTSTSSTSSSLSSTSSSTSSTSSSISSTSSSSTSSSTSISSTSSSISSTSFSSTSQSSTSSSTSISSTSSSISSTSSSISSTSSSVSSTSFSSTSSSSSTSTTAIPLNLNYRYEDDNILDTDNTNLDNAFNNAQVSDVGGDDGDYFIEYGSEYMIRQYKYDNTNNTDSIKFTWKGRSTESTVTSPIFIQIYNVISAAWETLARETRVPADTDFTATVTQTANLSNYYDSNNIVTFRSYQQVI